MLRLDNQTGEDKGGVIGEDTIPEESEVWEAVAATGDGIRAIEERIEDLPETKRSETRAEIDIVLEILENDVPREIVEIIQGMDQALIRNINLAAGYIGSGDGNLYYQRLCAEYNGDPRIPTLMRWIGVDHARGRKTKSSREIGTRVHVIRQIRRLLVDQK